MIKVIYFFNLNICDKQNAGLIAFVRVLEYIKNRKYTNAAALLIAFSSVQAICWLDLTTLPSLSGPALSMKVSIVFLVIIFNESY